MKKSIILMSFLFLASFSFQNGSLAEDCVSLDYKTAAVKLVSGSYKIVDGPYGDHWAFDFGPLKDEAYASLRIIKGYKLAFSCFVGRPNPSFKYLLTERRVAPTGTLLPNEDCISFNTANVQAKWFANTNSWKIVDGNHWIADFGLKQDEVHEALEIIKKYRFSKQCFVGRPDPSFVYWKR